MTQLDLCVFGIPRVSRETEELEFRTRKSLALLIYLAVETGWHSREMLAELLWRDNGRVLLRSALARLRKALGEDSRQVLQVERERICIDPSAEIRLDLDKVRAAAESIHTGQPNENRIELLREGVRAYQGPFLHSFHLHEAPRFEQWVQRKREAWRQRSELVFDALTRELIARGQLVEAGEILADWTDLEPLNELAVRRTIKLHHVRGNLNAALRVFDRYQSHLADEMELEPDPKTQELVARLRQDGGSETKDRPRAAVQSSPKVERPPALPLVGREETWRALLDSYRSLRQGSAAIEILEGEAGIGKSRIGEEFTRWAEAEGALCLRARGYPAARGPAYGLVAQALRPEIINESGPVSELGTDWLVELARLFPELRDREPDLPRVGEVGPEARTRLFEAVTRFGSQLAERAPLICWLDDLQWADEDSMAMLAYAFERWQRESRAVMIVGARRDPGLGDTDVSEFISRGEWRSLRVGRLDRGEVRRLVRTVSGGDGAESAPERHSGERQLPQWDDLSRWLYHESEGHPLYLESLIKELVDREVLSWHQEPTDARQLEFTEIASVQALEELAGVLPSGVQRVLSGRIERLSEPAKEALVGVAVLGMDSGPEMLASVVDLQPAALIKAMDELEARGLVEAKDEGGDGWRVTHHKIGDIAYQQAGRLRRRLFHGRALPALRDREVPPGRLAHHAEQAGFLRRAARFELEAARVARNALALHQAAHHLERGMDLLERAPDESPEPDLGLPLWINLRSEAARVSELLGEYQRARDLYQQMAEVGADANRYDVVATACNREATLASQASQHERARELLDRALRAARRAEDRRVLAETRWNRAQLAFYELRSAEVIRHGKPALEAAQAVGDPLLVARCKNVLGYGYRNQGRVGRAEELARAAAKTFEEHGEKALEADSLGLLAQVQLLAANPQEAVTTAERGLKLARKMGNPWGQLQLGTTQVMALLELAELAQAESVLDDVGGVDGGRDLHKRTPPELMMGALVARALLAPDEALDLHRKALQRYEEGGMALPEAALESALCGDHALLGEWKRAEELASSVLSVDEPIWYLFIGMSPWLDAEALVRAGSRDRAQELVSRLEEQASTTPRMKIPFLRSSAVLASAEDRLDAATEHCQAALAFAEQRGLALETWRAKRALVPLYERTGELDLAQSLDESTAQEFASMLSELPYGNPQAAELRSAS